MAVSFGVRCIITRIERYVLHTIMLSDSYYNNRDCVVHQDSLYLITCLHMLLQLVCINWTCILCGIPLLTVTML